ncbi:MAG: hypothetical protein R3E93_03145 [Thiothrix sp.]
MIDFMQKIMQSTTNSITDAITFLIIAIFYEVTVLQLPIPEIFNMLGMLVIIALGINLIIAPENPLPQRIFNTDFHNVKQ